MHGPWMFRFQYYYVQDDILTMSEDFPQALKGVSGVKNISSLLFKKFE